MLEPAKTVIEICGGFSETAAMARRDETRVRRWTYPKDRGGTGGLIPSECQVTLLKEAKRRNIALFPEHFFAGVLQTDTSFSAPHTGAEDAR